MNNKDQKCEKSGELLKASQFASLKREGEPAEKEHENLVCRNYPKCDLAEKTKNDQNQNR